MRTYCTLFDSKYAAFGIALYRSLLRFDNQFHLFILCLDEDIYRVLSSLQLEKVTLVSKSQLYPHIFTAVQDRMTAAQMCWLAQPLFCQYLLENFPLDHVVYMDSDCYFMNSPEPIWKEISDKGQVSATMVPHRFPQNLRHLEPVSGKFCVQFNYFTEEEVAT